MCVGSLVEHVQGLYDGCTYNAMYVGLLGSGYKVSV